MNQDNEHLNLLSIFHYVLAGVMALFSCIPFIHFFLGAALTFGGLGEGDPGAGGVGILIMVVAGLIILVGWTISTLVFFAGRNLKSRTRYTYCLVIAGIECLFMPMGTVLGVFTIIVLMRDTVKPLFDGGRAVEAEIVSS
jgi:hypothetical protein